MNCDILMQLAACCSGAVQLGMRVRFNLFFLLVALAAFCQEPQPQAQPPAPTTQIKPVERCTVEGTITSQKSGQPLTKADIELRGHENKKEIVYAATTDSAGHYVVEDIDPGTYTLSVTRNGYVRTSYGEDAKRQTATIISLAAGQHMTKVDVKLPPQAVVTGLVVDEGNEPMANVSVQLLSIGYENGKRATRPSGRTGLTNDKGEYRIFGVAPGKYWVRASARTGRMTMAEVRTQKKGQTTYAELYFPGGLSMAEASPIHLAAGEELNGIDFRIIKVKSFSIFGRLLGGSGSASSFVQLMPLDDTNGSVSWNASQMAQVDSDGKFAFHECRPGRFALTARSFSDDNHASAHAEVSIADSDVNVSLEFGQNPDLQGSIRSDDPNETLKPGISVFLRPEANGPFFGMPAETREDGTFTLKSVSLERVRVSIQPIPDGHYIKSIQLGNVQAEDDALDLTNGAPGELVITLGSKGATVTGTVQDDQQKILTNARIVLVPDNRKLESHFETGSPDQNGQFSIKNVPPGSYKLFAFDNAEFGSWLDPEWLKPYDSKGEAIEVKESEKVTKGLTLIKTGDL